MAESFEELLLTGGLGPQTARRLASLRLPAVRLSSRRLANDSEAPVGASKVGGMPDLARGFKWPYWKGNPLAFLGQVNLADVGRYPFCSALPQAGLLSFLYDREQETWGFDPKDRGSWLVHLESNPSFLQRCAYPQTAPSPAVYPPCLLEPSEVQTSPAVDSSAVEDLGLTPEDLDAYGQVLEQVREPKPDGAPEHQLLGHPSPIQGDMQLECELVSHGIYCGDPSGYQDPRAQALASGASRWRLLMQIDTDDNAEMMWGDCGRLYFWITDDALRRRAFEECWMVLQCS